MKARGILFVMFLSALESTATWGFMGKLLDMHRADGERVLTAAGN